MYARIPAFFVVALCGFVCGGCASKPAPVDVWADAAIVAGQRAIIEEQRRTLDHMGQAIGAIRDDLSGARKDLDRAIGETTELRELFGAIDTFVREIIEAEQRLEELQRPDSPKDA